MDLKGGGLLKNHLEYQHVINLKVHYANLYNLESSLILRYRINTRLLYHIQHLLKFQQNCAISYCVVVIIHSEMQL